MDPQELVVGWLDGRARVVPGQGLEFSPKPASSLSEKCRLAYAWLSRRVIYAPYADLELGQRVSLGGVGTGGAQLDLHEGEAFASFLLLPLLNLLCGRRLLFVGAPGRGKTTVATLMALLAGGEPSAVRRAIQHGHPQLSISELLGSPLPGDMVRATAAEQIPVAWRKWLRMRVKIIDEYNRIPTKTQSALLSLMAEGYAEMYEQIIECGDSAWFLTANDDLGGGTFPVIQALRDRIDVVVRCPPLDVSRIPSLLARTGRGDVVPADIVFTDGELAAAAREIGATPIGDGVAEAVGFLMGQLEFCRQASTRVEYMSKDTLHLSGQQLAHVCTEDCPLDKNENLCTQADSGLSARAVQTLFHFARALAWFRGADAVDIADVRLLLPWVLHDRLKPNIRSDFFQKSENRVLLVDRAAWIQQLLDRALQQLAARQEERAAIAALEDGLDDGLTRAALRSRLSQAQARIEQLLQGSELNAPVHAELLRLKSIAYRCRRHLEVR